MNTILMIDDEKELVELLSDELEDRGHQVYAAYDGMEGIRLAKKTQPDLIILDIMMPGADGFEVCRSIREDVMCPIIFLSARRSEVDKLKGFALGGDDFVTKPFGLKELLARIEANLRRERRSQYREMKNPRSKLYFGELSLDMEARELRGKGMDVNLTRREYEIVELLALHAGQVFSREQIYEKVWGLEANGDNTTVSEHIKKIRAKLTNVDSRTEYITTVWGIGYKWNKM